MEFGNFRDALELNDHQTIYYDVRNETLVQLDAVPPDFHATSRSTV